MKRAFLSCVTAFIVLWFVCLHLISMSRKTKSIAQTLILYSRFRFRRTLVPSRLLFVHERVLGNTRYAPVYPRHVKKEINGLECVLYIKTTADNASMRVGLINARQPKPRISLESEKGRIIKKLESGSTRRCHTCSPDCPF